MFNIHCFGPKAPQITTILPKSAGFADFSMATALRSFARQVEQFLARMKAGATAPRESRETPTLEKRGASESLGYVPGASASSSATPSVHLQIPTPPTIPAPPIPKEGSPRSRENAHSSCCCYSKSRGKEGPLQTKTALLGLWKIFFRRKTQSGRFLRKKTKSGRFKCTEHHSVLRTLRHSKTRISGRFGSNSGR